MACLHPDVRLLIDKALAGSVDGVDVPKLLRRCLAATSWYPLTVELIEERLGQIRGYQDKLRALCKSPGITQRTPEWYEARQNMITASDMAQALGEGKFGTKKDLIIKKCGYKEEAPFPSFLAPLKWGVRYEDVALAMYKKYMNVEVHEFGLIPHPHVDFFGASPDGITDMGVMVEIKCPFKRKMTGEIPTQYYYQIQGQLDVCDLEECDYVECELKEYETAEAFWSDTAPANRRYTEDWRDKGIAIEYKRMNDDNSQHVYSPISPPMEELKAWLMENIQVLRAAYDTDPNNPLVLNVYFFRVVQFSVKRVMRDYLFIQNKLGELSVVWNKILEYRGNKELYVKEMEAPSTRGQPKQAAAGGAIPKPRSSNPTPSFRIQTNTLMQPKGFAFVEDDD